MNLLTERTVDNLLYPGHNFIKYFLFPLPELKFILLDLSEWSKTSKYSLLYHKIHEKKKKKKYSYFYHKYTINQHIFALLS